VASLEHALEIARRTRAPCELLSLLLGPYASFPDRLDLGLSHQVVQLSLVVPVVYIKSILEMLGDVLKVLVATGRCLLVGGGLKDAVLAVTETAAKDDLWTQLSLC
jgi:hypothetical protein